MNGVVSLFHRILASIARWQRVPRVRYALGLRGSPHMTWTAEPTVSELLRDPIVQAVMVADCVDQRELDVLLATVRRHLRQRAEPSFAVSARRAGPQC